jgi:hypothetical protein
MKKTKYMRKISVMVDTKDVSNFAMALLCDEKHHSGVGYWGCGKCANGFVVASEKGTVPWYCPFCGDSDLIPR